MISLNHLRDECISIYGIAIDVSQPGTAGAPILIRFGDLDDRRSFALKCVRGWRTTRISFEPDVFSGDVINFLASQLVIKSGEVSNIIKRGRGNVSNLRLLINGGDFLAFNPKGFENITSLEFEADVLSADSSLEFALVNGVEEGLIRLAIAIFAQLLPILNYDFRGPDEADGYPEGAVSSVLVNRYERDPRNRRMAIDVHGLQCAVCGFDFAMKYGELGAKYIVIHHKIPVSEIGPDYVIKPESDLVPLCANCHAMVHRRTPPLDIDELKSLIR